MCRNALSSFSHTTPFPSPPLFLPLILLPFSPPFLSSLTFPLSSFLSCPPSFPLQQGKVEAALSDYAKVCELDPGNTEALSRQAMHKFEQGYVHAWPYIRCDCAHMHINIEQLHVHVPPTHIQAMVSCYSALHHSPSQEPQWYICQNSSCQGTIQPGKCVSNNPPTCITSSPSFSFSSPLLPPLLPSLLSFPLSSPFLLLPHRVISWMPYGICQQLFTLTQMDLRHSTTELACWGGTYIHTHTYTSTHLCMWLAKH